MRHLKFSLPLASWALIILILCCMPGNKFPHLKYAFPIPIDKMVHFILFFVLGFLLLRALNGLDVYTSFSRAGIFTILYCLAYGILIEILQGLVFTSRSAEIMDALADLTGAFGGVIIFRTLYKRRLLF